jgi:UDP-glucuronate 4-epimerase
MKKQILVTGGAGFIGFHTCKKLLESNFNVLCIDNINNYYSQNLKKKRIEFLKKKFKNFEFIKLNICNYTNLCKILKNKKIIKIIHLAAQAGVRQAYFNPRSYMNSNLNGFFNVLEIAREKKIKEIISASSSSVYGNQKKFPIKESYNSSEPIQFYAATKKCNEVMAYSYFKMFKINFVFMRFFTVYGPWGRPDMSIFKFTKNILSGKKIDVYNFGKHSRDFTYIDDAVEGILKLFKKNNKGFNIYNIGSEKKISLMELINKIEKFLNKKALLNYIKMQPGDIQETCSSTYKIKQYTGYKSKYNIDYGLKQFIAWFKEFYKK